MPEDRTSDSVLKGNLRRIWTKSYEHAAALKRDCYTCQDCGVKKSKAKGKEQSVHVHHKRGNIDWQKIYDVLREELFCDVEHLETLCPDCHDKKS